MTDLPEPQTTANSTGRPRLRTFAIVVALLLGLAGTGLGISGMREAEDLRNANSRQWRAIGDLESTVRDLESEIGRLEATVSDVDRATDDLSASVDDRIDCINDNAMDLEGLILRGQPIYLLRINC